MGSLGFLDCAQTQFTATVIHLSDQNCSIGNSQKQCYAQERPLLLIIITCQLTRKVIKQQLCNGFSPTAPNLQGQSFCWLFFGCKNTYMASFTIMSGKTSVRMPNFPHQMVKQKLKSHIQVLELSTHQKQQAAPANVMFSDIAFEYMRSLHPAPMITYSMQYRLHNSFLTLSHTTFQGLFQLWWL